MQSKGFQGSSDFRCGKRLCIKWQVEKVCGGHQSVIHTPFLKTLCCNHCLYVRICVFLICEVSILLSDYIRCLCRDPGAAVLGEAQLNGFCVSLCPLQQGSYCVYDMLGQAVDISITGVMHVLLRVFVWLCTFPSQLIVSKSPQTVCFLCVARQHFSVVTQLVLQVTHQMNLLLLLIAATVFMLIMCKINSWLVISAFVQGDAQWGNNCMSHHLILSQCHRDLKIIVIM